MFTSVAAIYRNGRTELLEPPLSVTEARVIVTFLTDGRAVDLTERGLGPEQVADLPARLKAFAGD